MYFAVVPCLQISEEKYGYPCELWPLDLPQRLTSTIARAYLLEDTFNAVVDSRS